MKQIAVMLVLAAMLMGYAASASADDTDGLLFPDRYLLEPQFGNCHIDYMISMLMAAFNARQVRPVSDFVLAPFSRPEHTFVNIDLVDMSVLPTWMPPVLSDATPYAYPQFPCCADYTFAENRAARIARF